MIWQHSPELSPITGNGNGTTAAGVMIGGPSGVVTDDMTVAGVMTGGPSGVVTDDSMAAGVMTGGQSEVIAGVLNEPLVTVATDDPLSK